MEDSGKLSSQAPSDRPLPGINRQILSLALPALGALIAEPLFLMADAAIVGHLGTSELAGVGLAGTLLQTAVGLLIFLAYGTTPAVARLIGAGQRSRALAVGKDGLWLALILGALLAGLGAWAGKPLLSLLGGHGDVLAAAQTYLVFSLPGVPAMLLVLAATGVLRGLQDARTPLVVAVAGFAVNAGLNFLLVYGFQWGVAGSAAGTSLTQWAMAAVYLILISRKLLADRVSLRPHWRGVRSQTGTGGWLFIRSLCLRVAMLATVLVATAQGELNLAGHQVALTLFSLMAFALDAIAIAAQSLIGKELGASNVAGVRVLTGRMVLWGIGFGLITGAVLALSAPWIGWVFSSDPQLVQALWPTILVLAVSQPISGVVFVLDGVLIGAGDMRYLAFAGIFALALYLPLLIWVGAAAGTETTALTWLWAAFALGYISARALTLGVRARGERWQRVGA